MLLDWVESLLLMGCSDVGVQNFVFINQGVGVQDPSLIHEVVEALLLGSKHGSIIHPGDAGFKLLDLIGKRCLHGCAGLVLDRSCF